jgi:hypothetical protein
VANLRFSSCYKHPSVRRVLGMIDLLPAESFTGEAEDISGRQKVGESTVLYAIKDNPGYLIIGHLSMRLVE